MRRMDRLRGVTRTLQPTCYPCDCSTVNENGKLLDDSSCHCVARTRLNSALSCLRRSRMADPHVTTARRALKQEFFTLLDTAAPSRDRIIEFLVNWPIFLPLWHPHANTVFRRLDLGDDHVVDFAYVRANTPGATWRFIHVGHPNTPLLENRVASKSLYDTAAVLSQWNDWFADNLDYAKDHFPFPEFTEREFLDCNPELVLVIGRRAQILEFQDHPTLENWSFVDPSVLPRITFVTFDSLADNFLNPSVHPRSPLSCCQFTDGRMRQCAEVPIQWFCHGHGQSAR